ncbi:hypothetical protein D2E60_08885 [Mycobacteroides abscessus]|nr:hypothetical protein D2E60_08885 [Mycobacteroides abscessus]RIS69026.1 hypothetical protein D2E54_24655 [Mycobacteroides abscessus]
MPFLLRSGPSHPSYLLAFSTSCWLIPSAPAAPTSANRTSSPSSLRVSPSALSKIAAWSARIPTAETTGSPAAADRADSAMPRCI